MKKLLGMAVAFVVGMAVSAGIAQQLGDAVAVDPDVHHVVIDNEHVRVFEARAAHGTKSPMHSHPPFVLVSVGSGRLKLTGQDGKTTILDVKPGQALWIPGAVHSWEVLGGELHGVAVEVKAAQKK